MVFVNFLMQMSSAVTGLLIMATLFRDRFPPHLRNYLEKYTQKLVLLFYPYVQITFPEFTGEYLRRNEAFTAIQNYLKEHATAKAKRLKADSVRDSQSPILTLDDNEEVIDVFRGGVKVWWSSSKVVSRSMSFSYFPASDERRFFKLTVHKRHRELITEEYVKHIMDEGKAIEVKNRQRKLYTNNPSHSWNRGLKQITWSHVVFEHPATFDTLAMEPKKKTEILGDLRKFSTGKEYYKKIGKAWKRGYLLYGPPGTGKSTMIAAMANFLDYDIYDLELTAVKDNTELRRLLIDTSSKSIIVIEDIDCSLDITGQRKKKAIKGDDTDDKNDLDKKMDKEEEHRPSKVTLSGLLNFIDGIWSSCGGERIVVFTTNYADKLDPALIRRGRMDKHIEMSYCGFEAFKVLADNYLDVKSHHLFATVEKLLGETDTTPADVAENLMPKSETDTAETCLLNLIEALEAEKKAKEDAKLKADNGCESDLTIS